MCKRMQMWTEETDWVLDRCQRVVKPGVVGNAALVFERSQRMVFGLGSIEKRGTTERTLIGDGDCCSC
eukprot:1040826-Pyramimonas_sp.AAC.1